MNKNNIAEEIKLRTLIRQAIKFKFKKDKQKNLLEEKQLRKIIRHFILEAKDIDADTKPAPYNSTPLNALADGFNQILPVLKTGLRGLNKPEERLSYRMHILSKFQSIFDGFEGLDVKAQGEGMVGESDIMEQEEDNLTITLDDDARVMPSDKSEEPRFAEKEKSDEEKFEDEFEAERDQAQDPTGARWAFETMNDSNIEQVLSDKRKLLRSPEYQEEFKEYCLYNVDLWLLTYEKEFSDGLGQEPAFSETIVPKPSGAEIQAPAEEFEGAVGDESGLPTFQ